MRRQRQHTLDVPYPTLPMLSVMSCALTTPLSGLFPASVSRSAFYRMTVAGDPGMPGIPCVPGTPEAPGIPGTPLGPCGFDHGIRAGERKDTRLIFR